MTDDELREQRQTETHNALDDVFVCVQSLLELAKKLNALNEPDGCEQWDFTEIDNFNESLEDIKQRLTSVSVYLDSEYLREVDDMASTYRDAVIATGGLPNEEQPPAPPEQDSREREKEILEITVSADKRLFELRKILRLRQGPDRDRRSWRSFNTQYLSNIANALVEYSSAVAVFFRNVNSQETGK
ncbi:MAG: hypothetical protein IJJ20_03445 [Thermoguttaceae bacterium]|nr:hypothetical protein [Thermoguttaceae bacterium]